jgi:hypothetical protein
MKRAMFGALIGENRLMRTYDSLGWSSWGWTPVIGLDVSGVREVIATFGYNIIALCELFNGNEAIYHSPDNGEHWTKVLEVTDIYDITSVGYNWTLASTSAGWYSSLKAGSSWNLVAAAGEGVPVGKSVVWVAPDHLFAHTGSEIWLSEDKAATWSPVCDLTAFSGHSTAHTSLNSIDGYYGRIIATCGRSLVETTDLGDTFAAINLSAKVRAWSLISAQDPIWRQVVFWDVLSPADPETSRWMVSAVLSESNIIRTFVNRGTGTFSPAVDMALSQRHRLNATVTRRAGADITETNLMITGDRRINGELRHAVTVSEDGIDFIDALGGSTNALATKTTSNLDRAHAALSAAYRRL